MPGPLADVDTLVAGITLDVSRQLYMGDNKTLRFIVPDASEVSKWRTVLTVIEGFDRISPEEKTLNEGSEVIFHVADIDDSLGSILGLTDLHVEIEDIIYSVGKTPPVASNEARVYVLTCKTRTRRTKFFDNSK